MAGYSGTPLPQKLGIKEGHRVGLLDEPDDFAKTLGRLPQDVSIVPASRGRDFDIVLFFVTNPARLASRLPTIKKKMSPETALWVCWPKKSSPLATDLDENGVRAAGLASGIVDVKICAVDEDWSGLKFVYRVKDRPQVSKARKK
ncbi:MAG TPA: DUF3052 domain-containing protein [Vicinamibacteria bacterium]|nr:DUF3052 domain-containing protein [Vicinamibacteria bacterium]